MTDLINDEAVYRTAPTTPGLLNITQKSNKTKKSLKKVKVTKK